MKNFKTKAARLDSRKRPLVDARQGFSLVETMVAIFVFSIVAALLAGAFSGFLKNYNSAKKNQRSAESAQYAINLMAKTIRNSTVAAFVQSATQITMYDNYEAKCVSYKFEVGLLKSANPAGGTDAATCLAAVGGATFSPMTNTDDLSSVAFHGSPSITGTSTGKILISATVPDGNSSQIQTTVSLRDNR